MAIIIGDPSLSADPSEGTLPFEITLRQHLGSTRPPEKATLIYEINAQNDVFFKVGAATPAKKFKVTKKVTQSKNQAFSDVVMLVQGAGTPKVEININETITGESGDPQVDSCLVDITTG